MSHALLRRVGVASATSALIVSGVALLAAPANAAADTHPATVGSSWLAGQLTSGLMHNPNYGGFDDYGLSIDTAFALDAVGGHPADVSAIETAVHNHLSDYTTGTGFGHPTEIYSGATAKALVLSQLGGGVGDPNLKAQLEPLVASSSPITGRIQDALDATDPYDADYANTIGQAFAANALAASSSTKAADALSFLLKQQCNAGYFRLYMTADPTATDQTCQGAAGTSAGAPDADATSTAIRMLLPQIDSSAAAARAIGKAEAWLLSQQHADGSFGGGVSTSASNANSTGLAGWALGELGDDAAATNAAVWVRGHQADEVGACTSTLSSQTGAIGYNDAAVTTGLTAGITDATSDQWRRATSQALPVLQWAPDATPALSLAGPTTFLKAGTKATFTASGVVPGDKVCLTGLGSPVRGVADASGNAVISAVLPAGTANRTVTVTDRAASTDTVVAKILGAKTLTVKVAPATVKRGKSVKVSVSGLVPGEQVTIRLRGRTLVSGPATSIGTLVRTIKVGTKLGKASVTALGQFGDIRNGKATITVVR